MFAIEKAENLLLDFRKPFRSNRCLGWHFNTFSELQRFIQSINLSLTVELHRDLLTNTISPNPKICSGACTEGTNWRRFAVAMIDKDPQALLNERNLCESLKTRSLGNLMALLKFLWLTVDGILADNMVNYTVLYCFGSSMYPKIGRWVNGASH